MRRIPTSKPAAKTAGAKKAPPKKAKAEVVEEEVIEEAEDLGEAEGEGEEEETAVSAPPKGVLAAMKSLADIGDYESGSVPLPEGRSFPWIGFMHENSKKATEVVEALGEVPDGTPYVCIEGNYFPILTCALITLAEVRYWCATAKGSSRDLIGVWFEEQPFGASFQGQKIQSAIACIVLILPGRGKNAALPDELAPAQVTVCDFRGPKAPLMIDYLKSVEESMTPEWAAEHGDLAGSVPPRFRTTAMISVKGRPGKGGYDYQEARGKCAPATTTQLEAIVKWKKDEEKQDQFNLAQEIWSERVAALRSQSLDASETATEEGGE